jgi:hypothetical protein
VNTDLLRHHLAAALAAVEAQTTTEGHVGPPTQASALHAAATLATAGIPGHASFTGEYDAELRIHLGDGDGEKLAAFIAYTQLLGGNLRDFRAVATDPGFQVWVTGDYPGTSSVRMVAVLDAEPDGEVLAGLRALCGTSGGAA